MAKTEKTKIEKTEKWVGKSEKYVGDSLDMIRQKKLRKILADALAGDTPRRVLYNPAGHAMVIMDDRVIIGKNGLQGGAAFGGKVSQFYYTDIINVAVQKNMVTAWVEIQTAAHQGMSTGDFWTGMGSFGKGTGPSPVSAENTLPANKAVLTVWQPALDELRGLIREARKPVATVVAAGGLGSELAKLAELAETGLLTDAEFAAAKASLLGAS